MSGRVPFVADGGDRLRRAVAALSPVQQREVWKRLAPPVAGRGGVPRRPQRTLAMVLRWLRECCAADPRLYVAGGAGARR